MNGNTLGNAVITALQGVNPDITPALAATMLPYWEAIATAIVSHIQSNAVVNPGTLGVDSTAATSIAGGNATVLNQGTGTIS